MTPAASHAPIPDHCDGHYLKTEFNALLRRRDDVNKFLIEAVLDGVWYRDLEHPEHEWMSRNFWRTLGYAPDAMPHLADAWQSIIEPEDLAVATENFQEHCADPTQPYDQIVRYRHAQGHTVWIRCRGMAIRNAAGDVTRMVGAHVDITALKAKEAELAEQNARLKEREERLEFRIQSLKDFASVVAHDLNAPLRQTSMFLGLLEADLNSAAEMSQSSKSAIDNMNAVLDRMRRIVKSLYELFKVGAYDLRPRPVPLADVIDAAIISSKDSLDARGATIDIGETPTMMIDPDLVSQVLQNILINACKYNDAEQMVIKITCEEDAGNDKMFVRIDDNGSGVPKGAEESIFEPYKRLEETEDVEGSGIGLALCRRIMSLHRGSIYVDPDHNNGARFVLVFPH